MKTQNFKLGFIAILMITCFNISAQAKTTVPALKADTSKMEKMKMSKMDHKMTKKKMAKKKMNKMKDTTSRM
jgi:hypothetical protein